jgi:hypothetical protein
LHHQVYEPLPVHFQCSVTELENWASRSFRVWRGADRLTLEGDGSFCTALHPRRPDTSVLQYVLFMECFWCDRMIHRVWCSWIRAS